MRLVPVPEFFACSVRDAIRASGDSATTTHNSRICVDSAKFLGALLVGLLRGELKERVLSAEYWGSLGLAADEADLCSEVRAIADGSYKAKRREEISSTGCVLPTLEAALWAFHRTSDFADGCRLAVNLGDDADTVGAVYGQLAGCCYGASHIPSKWVESLSLRPLLSLFGSLMSEKFVSDTVGADGRSSSLEIASREFAVFQRLFLSMEKHFRTDFASFMPHVTAPLLRLESDVGREKAARLGDCFTGLNEYYVLATRRRWGKAKKAVAVQ